MAPLSVSFFDLLPPRWTSFVRRQDWSQTKARRFVVCPGSPHFRHLSIMPSGPSIALIVYVCAQRHRRNRTWVLCPPGEKGLRARSFTLHLVLSQTKRALRSIAR